MTDYIPENQVTKERLEQLFKSAYLPVERDNDDDLVIRDNGINTFVMVNEQRKQITFVSIWGFRASASEMAKLRYVNELNDSLSLVRFCMPEGRSSIMYCDYQLHFWEGIGPSQIVRTYRLFNEVCSDAAARDSEDLLGGD